MSFDEITLPLRIGFGSAGGPEFSTEIITVDNGAERRNQNWAQPRRRYDAATGLRSAADAATLTAFFLARAGRARGFRLTDYTDHSSAPNGVDAPLPTHQLIGYGDGETQSWQLIKNYISGDVTHTRPIRKPVATSVVISFNGTPQADIFTVNASTGEILFESPPPPDVEIKAGYYFDVPVRFDTDQLSLSAENFSGAHSQIPLLEIRV